MRRLAGGAVAVAVLASLLLAMPAQALAPSLHVTADNLPTWQTNGTVWGLASAGGKVFAGGGFTQVRPPGAAEGSASSIARSGLVVLDAATGSPSSTCVLNVTRGTAAAVVRAVATSPDKGTVYIGGLFERVGTSNRKNIASIDVATCTVNAFNPQPSSFVYAIAATASSVYFGGNFTAVGTQPRSRLAQASVAGALMAWAPTTDDEVFALAVDPTTAGQGNVVIGGRSSTMNGVDSNALAVVDGVGGKSNVHTYPRPFFPWTPGTGQRTGTSAVKTISIDATGFYVGNEGTGGGVFDGRTAFNWGTYNQRWRDNCLGATQALVPINGVLYSASHSHNCESENTFEDGQRHFFTAENTADKQYQPWWPQANDGIGEGIGPRALTLANTASGDYLWAGGEFTLINGVAQRGLARFGQSPDTAAPAVPATPNAVSLSSGQATVTWRTTTDNDDKSLTYTLYRGTSATPIATLRADSQFYIRPQLSFTDVRLTPGQTVSYRVKASDGTNTSAYSLSRSVTVAGSAGAYPAKIRADGASVYFRMEEPTGTPAGSLGSSALGGSYVNASTRAGQGGALLSQPGQSALFDGTSSFLRTEVRTQAPTTYSIETWFKTTTTRGGKLVGYGNRVNMNAATTVPLSSNYDRQIYMTNDGRVLFGVNPGTKVTLSSAAGLNNGQWHQVVATQGTTGMALYIDGVRVAANTTTGAQSFQGYWRIGGDNLTGWASRPLSNYFAGNLAETAIYPSVLTTAKVADHYRLSGRTLAGDAADTQAPSAPAGLAASASSGTVDLSWTESTDNVAVTGYEVHRSSVSGFSSSAANKIADVPSGTSSYSDLSRPAGTWFYRVVAVDAAGNASAASAQTSAAVASSTDTTVPSAPTGLTSTVSGSAVSLSWTASTDNVSVMGYQVYRSATSGYTPSAATRVGSPTGTTFTDPAVTGGTWFYRVVALDAAGNSSAASAQVTAVVSAPADNQKPTVPAGLAAAVSGSSVALTWSASTDDVGVAGYDVHRSATSGFIADATTKIGTVTSGITYTDADRPVGTWFYRVVAVDAAGNASAASVQASAVVSGGAVQTVVLSPTEDSYAVQAAPGTNVGTSSSLNARGGTSSFAAYLKFEMPAAPAGTSLVGATLSVRATTDAAAGSADSYVVSLAPNLWTETGLTWANRPAMGAAVGSFGPPTLPDTRYNAIVESSSLSGLAGGPVTLVVGSASSTDNFQFWSRNHAAVSFRPTLTLTYQAN